MHPVFTISLDFELHWGSFEKRPLKDYHTYFLNTRLAIPQMLNLFKEYEVHATWATVGLLFHESKKELQAALPLLLPAYEHEELSAYHFMDTMGIGEGETTDPFHYGQSLIRKIVSTPGQEIGSHTFGHFYCNEPGQTLAAFEADLQAARRAAEKMGIDLKSLVFPRNQFNSSYLRVCYSNGFTAVRSNPRDWFWKIDSTVDEPRFKRLARGLDAYVPVGERSSYDLSGCTREEGLPYCLPASRLLRPYRKRDLLMNQLRINRILSEMNGAARLGHVYHLWWHPHNFGAHPAQSLKELERILKAYRQLHLRYGMESLSMGELSECLLTRDEKN